MHSYVKHNHSYAYMRPYKHFQFNPPELYSCVVLGLVVYYMELVNNADKRQMRKLFSRLL